MRLLAYGDRALLAEFATQKDVLGALAAWQDAPPGVLELVPAARTVLVRVDPGVLGLGHLERWQHGFSVADDERGQQRRRRRHPGGAISSRSG